MVFRWWIGIELLGLVSLPLCFWLFRPSRERGLALSKLVGVFAFAFFNWWLGSAHLLKFFAGSQWVSLALMLALAVIAGLFVGDRLWDFLRWRWKLVLVVEGLFLGGFLLYCFIRSFSPEIAYDPGLSAAEKFPNSMVLNSLYRATWFPPQDLWLSGNPLNYYYFGHLEWASLGRLMGVPSEYAFNLGLATLFAFALLGGFALGYNLWARVRWGLLLAVVVAMFGNLDALNQILSGLGAVSFRQALLNLDFWRSSRMIEFTITEFPAFTELLGDLHAHHSGLINFLIVLNLMVVFWSRWRIRSENLAAWLKGSWRYFVVLGVFLGAAYTINTWDALSLWGFWALILGYLMLLKLKFNFKTILVWGGVVVGVFAIGYVLFMPFTRQFEPPMERELKILSLFPPKLIVKLPVKPLPMFIKTELTEYWGHWGLFLLPLVWFMFNRWWRWTKRRQPRWFFPELLLAAGVGIHLSLLLHNPIYGVGLVLGVAGYVLLGWYFTIPAAVVLIGGYLLFHYWLIGTLLVLSMVAVGLLTRARLFEERWIVMMALWGFAIGLFGELVVFDDRYAGEWERYNTVFKFYFPMWAMMGVAAVGVFARWKKKWNLKKWAALVVFILLGMLYFPGATYMRTHQFHKWRQPSPRGLDGLAYLAGTEMKDDLVVIRWIKDNIEGQPVLLEATGGPYTHFSRVATATGLPTLLGWEHHVAQWRGAKVFKGPDEVPEQVRVAPRKAAIQQIYSAADLGSVWPLIRKYGIRYIFVGSLERKNFKPEALEKFNALPKVFSYGESALYEVKMRGGD